MLGYRVLAAGDGGERAAAGQRIAFAHDEDVARNRPVSMAVLGPPSRRTRARSHVVDGDGPAGAEGREEEGDHLAQVAPADELAAPATIISSLAASPSRLALNTIWP
jgi:hypothetical protein